jgi:hypothetical protein
LFSPIGGISIFAEGKERLKENHQGFPLRSEVTGSSPGIPAKCKIKYQKYIYMSKASSYSLLLTRYEGLSGNNSGCRKG